MLTRVVAAMVLSAAPAAAFELDWPIACVLGEDCFIQQYPDHDPGSGAADSFCGGATYDGHDGTDIRLRTTADVGKGVAVLAARAGVVKGYRDGEPDRLVRTQSDRAAVADKECGNGVVLAHEDGWETQYCHMRNGSVRVKKGDKVEAGTKLGEVGYSGWAAFPHLHLSVRRGKREADPFDGTWVMDACEKDTGGTLWAKSIEDFRGYETARILGRGFADHPVELAEIEEGRVGEPDLSNGILVGWAWAINLRKGDELAVSLQGPGGVLAEASETMDRHKAQYMLFAGKKNLTRPASGYPASVTVTIRRNGQLVAQETYVGAY